jgi:hydroxymethylpyrimidine pyrophosphatase-like HAD family hydrolase
LTALVVTDLDGTLWAPGELIHPATRAAWAELDRRGVPVLVATGRRLTTTRAPLARAELAPPAVVLNGALAVDLATDERFHRHTYHPGDAATVLAAFRAAGLEPCVYVEHDDIEVYVGGRPSTHPDHLASFGPRAVTADLDEIVAGMPVLSFGVIGHDGAVLARVPGQLDGHAETHLDDDRTFGGSTLTVSPRGLSKWAGVVAYCARAGLDPADAIAIGDGPNDRELLTHAAVAVVPSDGSADALALADHVVPPAAEGGWARVLELV